MQHVLEHLVPLHDQSIRARIDLAATIPASATAQRLIFRKRPLLAYFFPVRFTLPARFCEGVRYMRDGLSRSPAVYSRGTVQRLNPRHIVVNSPSAVVFPLLFSHSCSANTSLVASFTGHTSWVLSVDCCSDGRHFATG